MDDEPLTPEEREWIAEQVKARRAAVPPEDVESEPAEAAPGEPAKGSGLWPWVVGAVFVIAVLFAMAGGDDSPSTSTDRPGDPGVYADIAATTNCATLQKGFDRNMDDFDRRGAGNHLADVVLGYANAYDAQMEAVGCYG